MKGNPSSAQQPPQVDFSFRQRYETLRSLLHQNGVALELMADLAADLNHLEHTDTALLRPLRRLLDQSWLMAEELNLLTGDKHRSLYGVIENLTKQIKGEFRDKKDTTDKALAFALSDTACFDSRLVGGKAAGLATLQKHFADRIPDGFVVTTEAYRSFIEANNLTAKIRLLLNDLESITDNDQFKSRTEALREMILKATVPDSILNAIKSHAKDDRTTWAVRSSALAEDERFSFAGQYDSLLNVKDEDLADAYRSVLAGRFSDRAIRYRLHYGIREVETPMAVLFLRMLKPKAAGVVYTKDPQDPASAKMMISVVPGLAHRMVRGEQKGDVIYLSKEGSLVSEKESTAQTQLPDFLSQSAIEELGRMAFSATRSLGYDMDIEWLFDESGKIWLLQGRRLSTATVEGRRRQRIHADPPMVEGGYTLFPGRAEGPVVHLEKPDPTELAGKGAVAVIDQGTPEFAPILPMVTALLIRHGSPVSHLAALIREFSVPCLYQLEDRVALLPKEAVISVDATKRRIFRGSRWDGVRKRSLARVEVAKQKHLSGPLYDRVLALNLTDPYASSFKAKKCESVHDVIRFIHEMSVRSMFGFGDTQNRFWRHKARRVQSPLPVKLRLIDLDGCAPDQKKILSPDSVNSIPFQALWKGVSDSRISWERPPIPNTDHLPPDFIEQIYGGTEGPRRSKDTNYAIVATDYLNLNARFAFHYAMVDAICGQGKENNHVHFRYRGGAAGDANRIRRAKFLEAILRTFHFGVDRREDLITAWLRNYTRSESEKALEMIGRLMACSRQLDMLLSDDQMVKPLVKRFLNEEYAAFA